MDGNVLPFAAVIKDAHERMKSIPVFHVGELFCAISWRLKGKQHERDRGPLDLQLESYHCVTIPRAVATFTDPSDGKKYRLIIEPVIEDAA